MKRGLLTFGIVMWGGVVIISAISYTWFPVALFGGTTRGAVETGIVLFITLGSFLSVWGLTELRARRRVNAFRSIVALLLFAVVFALFCASFGLVPKIYAFVTLGLAVGISMCSLPLSRYLDRRRSKRHGTPQSR
jgi:hypothetical protein